MTWAPCGSCGSTAGADYVGHNMGWVAVCPHCGYILTSGQTRTEVAMQYTRAYRIRGSPA